ncbi:alkaline phosphatase family protein [Dyella flagellata]|uniref:Phosphoesterase n=1 Tax=Dyella flagellata TaxID=1867833 RepID=A0ABQ5XG52_9GAMM|nr:alkaline phosphatase family protein [Dyella flagellata]GLQ90196.1 phosphoesterase [Dyella flagellata]
MTTPGNSLSAINHIVVLMLENRSFDHMLGFLYADAGNVSPAGQAYEGLTGKESNPDANGKPVSVFKIKGGTSSTYFMPGADPGEGYTATNSQLFGSNTAPTPPTAGNQGFVSNFAYTLSWESKSTGYSILPGTTANDIMGMHTPQTLPVLCALARGFAVCDHWYGSVPTETLPNRAFVHAATSQGHMDDKTKTFTAPTIYAALDSKQISWKIYGYDAEPLTRHSFTDITNLPDSYFGLFKDFQSDAANGSLPAYSFLEPSWGTKGNSQHPNYDVALGEQFIHDVYYALRNSPQWNQTLLIITYDEHGGCYDHVSPPTNAVPPDSSAGEYGFDFKRFGPRVPTLLISPLIPAGTVFRASGATPFDHTSILKTAQLRWSLPALTARDAAAPDVGNVLSLHTPRKDDPLAGVAVPQSKGTNPSTNKPSHLQQVYAELAAHLPMPDPAPGAQPGIAKLKTADDYDRYIKERVAGWKARRKR